MLDANLESNFNLSLIDPAKWGWSAGGKVVQLLTPHEVCHVIGRMQSKNRDRKRDRAVRLLSCHGCCGVVAGTVLNTKVY